MNKQVVCVGLMIVTVFLVCPSQLPEDGDEAWQMTQFVTFAEFAKDLRRAHERGDTHKVLRIIQERENFKKECEDVCLDDINPLLSKQKQIDKKAKL